ncbi:MAG: hypothetical protein WC716_00805 [Chitinophagaceae bacterium]|jgi:hypothetical protein
MKQLLFLGILILVFNTNTFAQIPVINQKGTKILIDSSKWSLSGSDIYNKNSGNVGLGTPSPTYKLDVTGKIRSTDSLIANSARVVSLPSGLVTDSIVVADPTTGILKRISANRLNKADSTTASNGITLTGKDIRLGGALTGATTVTTSAANTLAISTLQSGTSNDSLVVADATTGVLRRISSSRISKADSTTASNGLTLSGKDVRLGGTLTSATTITNSGANTLRVSGLASGDMNDSLVVADPTSGELLRVSSSRLNKADSTTASNGLTLSGKDVRLGGTLTSATTITNSGANTLRVSGLASGDMNDSLVVADPTSGELLRVSSSRLNKADSTTASNGLILSGKDVRLGGTLTSATTITNSGVNTLRVSGLASGDMNDSLVVADPTSGELLRVSSSRLNKADSTTASNGLTLSGKDVRLGGTLTSATTITNSGANTLRVSGLASGDMNDSLVVADPTSGELLRVSSSRLNKADSSTASNGITMTGKDIRLGGALIAATSITTTATNTIAMAGLQNGSMNDSVVVSDPSSGVLRRVSSSRLNKADSTTASNGLTLTGKDVRLGGALTAATTVTTTATNTLSVAGLQNGTANDSLVVADASTGLLKRISSSRISSGLAWGLTGNAGTTPGTQFIGTTDNVDLVFKVNSVEAGRLNLFNLSASMGYSSVAGYKSSVLGYTATTSTNSEAVAVGYNARAAYQSVTVGSDAITTSNNSIALGQNSNAAYQATAIGSGSSATGNNSTAIGFGATTSQANALILGNSSAQVGIGTSTPGYALDVNAGSNPLKLSGVQSGVLTDSILTINTTGVVRRIASSRVNVADSTTASNGITLTGKDIRLGGSLTAATTITTTASNTLSIAGLQSGNTNDSVLMITSGNIVRRINSSSISKEPFNVVGGSVQATSNTQDIYTQGNLSVGKTANSATLEVGGKVKADSTISAPNFATLYQTLTSGTVAWNQQLGSTATVTLTSNSTLSITNATTGMYGLLKVVQDGTGGRTLTLPAGSKVINGGGGVALLTTTGNAVDILTYFYDGTNYWWTIGNNYN